MSWTAITEALLVTRISGSELTALRAAALADGQADPVAPAIAQVTDLVRGYVAACARNSLGAAGTIPAKLIGPACTLVMAAICARVPGYALDEDRRADRRNAIDLLEQVAACKFAVEDPDSTEDVISTPTPQMSDPDLHFTRPRQEGI